MKLLPKTILYFFLFSLAAFLISGVIFYFSTKRVIYEHIDSSLITEKDLIQEQIEHTDSIPDLSVSFGRLIEVKMYDESIVPQQIISDCYLDTISDQRDLPFRHLAFAGVTPSGKGFTIDVYHPLSEMQELMRSITFSLFSLFIALTIVFIVLNYYVSRRLWVPFYDALRKMSNFDISSKEPLELMKTNTQEFRRLNNTLTRIGAKMRKDYFNLREFNENASHEIQTPLAVIRTKLELLMQYENLTKEQVNLLQSSHEATSRLSRLNQGLLLISKIDNQQFATTEKVSFNQLILKFLNNFEEVIQLKQIKVETHFDGELNFDMNPVLADILVSNLIANAVKHNLYGGSITCTLSQRGFTLSNDGKQLDLDPSVLFQRFRKGNENSDSVGLGLSIVSRICAENNLSIRYTCIDKMHSLEVALP